MNPVRSAWRFLTQWQSPLRVHYTAFAVATCAVTGILLLAGIRFQTAFGVGAGIGVVVESFVDWWWSKRHHG
jgi:hypothetical protein